MDEKAPELKRELGLRLRCSPSPAFVGMLVPPPPMPVRGLSPMAAGGVALHDPAGHCRGRDAVKYSWHRRPIWTRYDFGRWHGFLAFTLYWIRIAFWFPSAAMFNTASAGIYVWVPAYAWLAWQPRLCSPSLVAMGSRSAPTWSV